MAKNNTTPIPSLKRDSPAICTSRSRGARNSFNRPITAIGSVGEISAPKVRQTTNGTAEPDQREHPPRETADDRGRQQDADGRQAAYRPLVRAQALQVDVEGPGEQEERQHPVHQRFVEVDAVHERRDTAGEFQLRKDRIGEEDGKGADERNCQGAAGCGKPQEAVVDVAGYCRDRRQDRSHVEAVHARASVHPTD